MFKAEVTSTAVTERSGVAAKTGKPYHMIEQTIYVSLFDSEGKPNRYPTALKVTLNDGQPPYPVGLYQVAPQSFYVDKFGQLACRVQLSQSAAVRAAA